eukprot:m51a1_g11700 Adaptor protein complex 2 (AP-2), sigma subunit (256) ;mRNA; r:36892-38375
MIHYLLVQNRSGKTRLSKWYVPYTEEEKGKLATEVYRLLNARDTRHTNFVEFRNYKLVYRRYVGLFFVMCVDVTDNELACLEAIHLFVEILDQYFGNVCELDLVYFFYKAYAVLDEIFLAGEIMETSRAAWYVPYTEEEKGKLATEVYRLLNARDTRHTNFVEFRNYKLVYRRYVGLFFVMCVDVTDNELACLEAIHLFVEILDQYFGNVCELDLVYFFYKAYAVLDEIFLAGEIMETSRAAVLTQLDKLDNMPQ